MEVIEKAPAKINLGLDTIGKRSDGFHELAMIMASVDLSDRLIMNTLPNDEIIIETEKSFLPVDKRNHIYQAAQLVKERFGIKEGLHVQLKKNIPVAAGLAGGSSDAAACLRGLNRLWHLNLSKEELAKLGEEIGSDVPYCVHGGTAYVSGRGEEVEILPSMPQCWVILVKPGISVSTASIFSALSLEGAVHPDISGLKQSVLEGNYQEMTKYLGNSLEKVTTKRHPVVKQIKQKMLDFGADNALMSGSGPTVFALCKNYSRAQRVYNALQGFCEEVYLVRTLK